MANLDMQYIADLVQHAQQGEANAFAELFAATYQKQFAFARSYLQDDVLAQEALQTTYIRALKNLSKLREPALVVAWLNRITLQSCFQLRYRSARLARDGGEEAASDNPENSMVQIEGRSYNVRQIMSLPFSEAQTLLLSKHCGMKTGAIASLLEIRRGAVRRYMENGRRRLAALNGAKVGGSR